ncbi:MAG: hypothetical protein EHM24_23585, partial [Acidobacteria bacterium]
MSALRELFRRGDPAIWLAGSGLGICILMIAGMIVLILANGLGFFWPRAVVEMTLADGTVLMGEVTGREGIPAPGTADHLRHNRIQLKLGNRDVTGVDFRWGNESEVSRRAQPRDAVYVERREYGPFIGRAVKLSDGDREVAAGSDAVLAALPPLVRAAGRDRDALRSLERDEIGAVNYRIEQARLRGRKLDLAARKNPGEDQSQERRELQEVLAALQAQYATLETRLGQAVEAASRARVTLRTAAGEEKDLPAL